MDAKFLDERFWKKFIGGVVRYGSGKGTFENRIKNAYTEDGKLIISLGRKRKDVSVSLKQLKVENGVIFPSGNGYNTFIMVKPGDEPVLRI